LTSETTGKAFNYVDKGDPGGNTTAGTGQGSVNSVALFSELDAGNAGTGFPVLLSWEAVETRGRFDGL
jgi:hypothetical protein